jgi:hypothetical protein
VERYGGGCPRASEEATMVGAIVTFQFADDFDRAKIEGAAREVAPMFEQVPGLRLKVFTVDESSRRAVNFYLWESRERATAFFTPELAQRAASLYGLPPTIELVDVAAVVDNSLSTEAVA